MMALEPDRFRRTATITAVHFAHSNSGYEEFAIYSFIPILWEIGFRN
jgi:hypothetical protein